MIELEVLKVVTGLNIVRIDDLPTCENNYDITYTELLEDGKEYSTTDDINYIMAKAKKWITLVRKTDINEDYAFTKCSSHNLFYTMRDGTSWYCGYAHVHSTYDNKAEFEDIAKGKTEAEAVFNACLKEMKC